MKICAWDVQQYNAKILKSDTILIISNCFPNNKAKKEKHCKT